ncbi:MAG: hypothetical protein KF760_28810 [Candidatus Eremiobacteraeota bacterium]|nr:hypothetical protein [Candidatus Eremiobacteraeota bacterium]MCW5865899.1 hypothetical protein [Candidatus Eremiobacteraeota bacterium]
MSSELQHLPPGVVAYLDALGRRGADPKALHSEFLAHLDMISEWITNLSDYTIDDTEAGQFANVRALLESTRSSAEEVAWGEQLPLLRRDLYPMFSMMDHVNKRREVATYSSQPAVNDFILCGAAYLQKRAPWEAVERRLDKLENYLNHLEAGLESVVHRLKPEVSEGAGTAIDAMRDAIDALTAGQSDDLVKSALGTLSESAQIIQLLIDWKRQDEERFRADHSRFLVPAAGPALESFLEYVDGVERGAWKAAVEPLVQETLPLMRSEWTAIRRRLFMDPDQREAMWAEMDAAMDNLEGAVEDLLNTGIGEEDALNGFEEAAEHLSAQFHQLSALTLPYSHLYGSEPGELLEGIFGALGGSVPVVRLKEIKAPGPVSLFIEQYAVDGDWDHLFRAGFTLLTHYPPPPPIEEPEQPRWNCPFCKAANEVGGLSCSGCGAAAPLPAAVATAD